MAFVWDEDKAAANVRKHGICFEYAVQVFESPVQAEWIDDREDYGEERWNVVGLIADLEVLVTYTIRGNDVRVLSARRPTRYERESFWRD